MPGRVPSCGMAGVRTRLPGPDVRLPRPAPEPATAPEDPLQLLPPLALAIGPAAVLLAPLAVSAVRVEGEDRDRRRAEVGAGPLLPPLLLPPPATPRASLAVDADRCSNMRLSMASVLSMVEASWEAVWELLPLLQLRPPTEEARTPPETADLESRTKRVRLG